MQNVDKYRTELLEEFERRKFENKDTDGDCFDIVDVYIDGIEAVKIRHNGGHLKFFSDSFEWLFSEWKPPLLENGDKLKAGDWVMVRDVDSQDFVKRQFLYYYDGNFVCAPKDASPVSGVCEFYNQARIPEYRE